ncbi:MAG: hypothetical protein KDA79_07675, partial [Planctomycetaceae bacterium]|nr:hypothetical protein [Planctomycetaceae bacterium]
TRLSSTDEEAIPRTRRRPVSQPVRGPQPAVACCTAGHSVAHELRQELNDTDDDLDDDDGNGPRPDESIAWPFPGVGRNV